MIIDNTHVIDPQPNLQSRGPSILYPCLLFHFIHPDIHFMSYDIGHLQSIWIVDSSSRWTTAKVNESNRLCMVEIKTQKKSWKRFPSSGGKNKFSPGLILPWPLCVWPVSYCAFPCRPTSGWPTSGMHNTTTIPVHIHLAVSLTCRRTNNNPCLSLL